MAAARKGLDFKLERRGHVWCVVYDRGGVRPASEVEVALWNRLRALSRKEGS